MHRTGLALCALVATLFGAVPGAQAQMNDEMMKRGRNLWTNRGCGSCHGIGKKMAGPDLMGVEQRRTRDWINRWLKDTDVMLGSDSTAMALLAEWKGIRMPKASLTDQDVEAILSYLRSEEAKIKAKGK